MESKDIGLQVGQSRGSTFLYNGITFDIIVIIIIIIIIIIIMTGKLHFEEMFLIYLKDIPT